MKLTDKMAVLAALEKQQTPLSLLEIQQQLKLNVAERTLRRWINKLVNENKVVKLGKKRGMRYQLASTNQSTNQIDIANAKTRTSNNFTFSRECQETIAYLQQALYERIPVPYKREWLKQYQPNKSFYLNKQQRKLLQLRGQPPMQAAAAGTYVRKIYDQLLVDLSFNSSRLEGNTYSLLDTEKLVIEGIPAVGKLDEEKIMILNHKEAIRHIVEKAASMELTVDEICTIHYLLAEDLVQKEYAGKIRDHAVRIGLSSFIPLDRTTELTSQLKLICHKASQIIDAYERSFFLLIHLSYLQAFTDVNKRTSRLSANIPLIQQNLYPLSFNFIDKSDYTTAIISIYELNDVRPLAELFIYSYLRTCQQFDAIRESIAIDDCRVRFRTARREMIRHIIEAVLVGKALTQYIKHEISKKIPQEFQKPVMEDLYEDLNDISLPHIQGIGISKQQLQKWLVQYKALSKH